MIVVIVSAACVLPVSALSAFVTDPECNHLGGNVEVAEPGTPRGSWCAAVVDHHHWILLLTGPSMITALIATVSMLLLVRWRRWTETSSGWLITLAWLIGSGIALVLMFYVFHLRDALTI